MTEIELAANAPEANAIAPATNMVLLNGHMTTQSSMVGNNVMRAAASFT